MVATNTEEELATREQLVRIFSTLKHLGANMLRVVRGAGKPHEVETQIHQLAEALVLYREAAGRSVSPDAIKAALSIDRDPELIAKISDDEVERLLAEDDIVRGALQVVASRLLGQLTQEAAGRQEIARGRLQLDQLRARQLAEFKAQEKARKALEKGPAKPRVKRRVVRKKKV